jgi:RNA polymerase sigma-70 factor (ECF subfamily)
MAAVREVERPVGDEDEGALVARARAGDRDAAAALLVRHELTVHRACAHLLPRGDDVEAAVQETFVRALRSLAHYGGSGSFAAWLASIAVNLCRDRLRRHRLVPFVALAGDDENERGPIAVLASGEPSPERAAMARQAMARVRTAVAALPERQREVFALRFWVGLDLAAIAEALGVDVGTVKTHLHRGVQKVRQAAEEAMP